MTAPPTDGPARRGGDRPGPAPRGNAAPELPDRSGGAISYLVVLYDGDEGAVWLDA